MAAVRRAGGADGDRLEPPRRADDGSGVPRPDLPQPLARRRRPRLGTGAVLLGLALPALGAAAPAAHVAAVPVATATPPAPARSALAASVPGTGRAGVAPQRSRQAQASVRRYWTPARMAAARPGELLEPVAGVRFERSAGVEAYLRRLRPRPASAPPVATTDPGTPWTGGGAVVRTTGKVFFSLGADDYVCSGSAVASPDRSTVLTAGHCVYDPESSTTATNWAFVPGYVNGRSPYGVFAARHLATTTGWRAREDYDVDVAFADVGPNAAGKALTDAVGGQPVAFGTPRGGLLHAFGYPAAAPWTGERLVHCAAPVVQDTTPDPSQDQGMTCAMTPGSSGGPWFAGFDPRTGRGTLVSVTSFSYSDQAGTLWGPWLGATAKALYDSVASAPGR